MRWSRVGIGLVVCEFGRRDEVVWKWSRELNVAVF